MNAPQADNETSDTYKPIHSVQVLECLIAIVVACIVIVAADAVVVSYDS